MVNHHRRSPTVPRAFTLIEMLVSISIIALLVAILLPALGRSRNAAKAAICLSDLHQLAVAQHAYLLDGRQRFWRYFADEPAGRRWWFGFEPGGPGSGTNRPLDKSRSTLARYLMTDSDVFNCPSFPYDHAKFFQKFDRRAASLGFNIHLGPANTAFAPTRADDIVHPSLVFVFADGIHFDNPTTFNEGHYVQYTPNTQMLSGYAHFRHMGQAHVQYIDGHAAGQKLAGTAHNDIAGLTGNLAAPDGSDRIYGF